MIFNWRRTRGNALPWKTPRVNKHLPTAYLLSKGLEWDTAPPAEVEMDADLQGSKSHSSLPIFPCGTSIKHYKKPHFFQIGSFQKGSSLLLLPLLFFPYFDIIMCWTFLSCEENCSKPRCTAGKQKMEKYFPWLHLDASSSVFSSSSFIGWITEVPLWGHQAVGRSSIRLVISLSPASKVSVLLFAPQGSNPN